MQILRHQWNDRAERHDFWSRFLPLILLFFFPLFLGGKRKGGKNNKSCGQKSCLSARSYFENVILLKMCFGLLHFTMALYRKKKVFIMLFYQNLLKEWDRKNFGLFWDLEELMFIILRYYLRQRWPQGPTSCKMWIQT